jgi:hypothetical protein
MYKCILPFAWMILKCIAAAQGSKSKSKAKGICGSAMYAGTAISINTTYFEFRDKEMQWQRLISSRQLAASRRFAFACLVDHPIYERVSNLIPLEGTWI